MNLISSYTAFGYITKLINIFLDKNNQPILEFNDDESHNIDELKKFFTVIESFRHYIFLSKETSPILKKLSGLLLKTKCLGDRNENTVKQILTSELGDDCCVLKKDNDFMKSNKFGIDLVLNFNNKKYTGKIKPFNNLYVKEGTVHIKCSSNLQIYHNVDVYVFVNVKTKTLKIYNTKNSRIFNGFYLIPKENEVITIVGDKNMEIIDCNKYLS